MCGIAGIVNFNNYNIASLPDLSDAIKHRGPDDEGFVFFKANNFTTFYGDATPKEVIESKTSFSPTQNIKTLTNNFDIGIAHRRLSIIDTSPFGHQPMCDISKKYWIAFNGEIYNYQSIKKELQQKGYTFISNTDTEVVLYAFIEWGKDCLNHFNGMWSFVIYNSDKKELFGARDRFGVKPFYYSKTDDYFSFASEIKSLLQLPNFKREINPKEAFNYLFFAKLESNEESMFKGIFELLPAHYFTLNLKTQDLKKYKYYQLITNKKPQKFNRLSFNDYCKEIYKKGYQSIELRLNADVKTGTCLSGGIDSSIITCVINDIIKRKNLSQIGEKQSVFTAIYPNSKIDEQNWAKEVVNSTKTDWFITKPTPENLKERLEELVYCQEIPFTATSTFSQFKVMELIHQKNVKVTLDGQGADELFGGYVPHYASLIFENLNHFQFKSFIANYFVKENAFANKKLVNKILLRHWYFNSYRKLYFKQMIKKQPELSFFNKNFIKNNNQNLFEQSNGIKSNLNELLQEQFTNYRLKHLLRTADRNAMHFSVESRMPFADDIDLIETAFQIPGNYKIYKGISKYLFRNAFKNLLPKKIWGRKDKIGFATPEKEWFIALKPYFKQIIFEQKPDEYIDWEGIQNNFDEIYNNAIHTNTQRFWRIINFAVWRKVYHI